MKKKKVAVVGGGISGLTVAYYLQRQFEVTIFEKEKWGGKASTVEINGYLFEEGVNGFLNNSPLTLELCREIGAEVIKANSNSKKRFIYDDRLYQLPSSPKEFLKSPILSPAGKLRLLKEPFIPPYCEEETVWEFALRRLGEEFARRFITPMVAGIYGATPDQLSVNAAFPRIKEVECTYKSLVRGMVKLRRGGAPTGELCSFNRGMSEMIQKLKQSIQGQFIERGVDDIGELGKFDIVILATPAYESSKILSRYSKISQLLGEIEYNPIGVVGLDYQEIYPEGFGILTTSSPTLGILMDKYIFPNRNGIRVMVGGGRHPEVGEMGGQKIINLAEEGVAQITGARFSKVRWVKLHKKGIPIYKLGHRKLIEEIEEEARKIGVHLLGNWKGGVSFNDCIKNGYKLAQQLIEGEK
jgi:oxygen-dependent protoporphyrinogen oxidase